KGTDVLVIASTGGSQTEELRRLYPHSNLIIEDFIPFNEVMPYAHVYITNGGYGGVMLGIQNKLPIIVAGVHEGKNEIAARIGYFRLGVNLKTEKPKPAQLKKAFEEIYNNPVYKRNVHILADEFQTYNPNRLFAKYMIELLSGQRVLKSVYKSLQIT
ncbi:MAG TPA: nucleotide disphospho-sugar-binding domain-containing protein, partial [Flavitalea sp.]|nr:nucleotide disphospho-sugar-binding domain-containing protein [Flavitalea sp.]